MNLRFSNFHTHTTFSDGAHTVEENIQAALAKKMRALGFSDHSFTPCDTSYCMKREDVLPYLACISEMKKRYERQIELYAGLELDYYSQADTDPFDYWIASVHYIIKDGICYPLDESPQKQKTCIREAFCGNTIDFAKCYFDMVAEMVERTKPAFVGHFDLINKFGLMPTDSEEYRKAARQALEQVVKICPYVEVNTGAMSRGWRTVPYPEKFLLQTLLEFGGQVILSSDSHNKDHLTYYFDEAAAELKKMGFDHICEISGGKMVSRGI